MPLTHFPPTEVCRETQQASYKRSFRSTVRQYAERVGLVAAPPSPPASHPTGISGTGVGERHFTGDPGFTIPPGLSALQALGALGATTAWTGDTFVTLGDGSTAWWNGTAWAAGKPGA